MTLFPVFEHPKIAAYPSDDAPECTYAPLHDVLTQEADSDAHFSAYSCPELPYRLKREVLKETAVHMHLFVFDVDDPVAHEQHIPARDEWRIGELQKIGRVEAHGVFIYETRGGYRIVARLPEPFLIQTPEDEALWTAWYKTNVKALKHLYDIQADDRCADWQRLFRLPHATRDGVLQNLPTYGDPNVGVWDIEPADEDFVEPETPRASAGARTITRTEPALPLRKARAMLHVAKMRPSVQGDGAEDTLWAVCNAALVGFDLPVEDAAEVIQTAHMPLSTLESPGPEHFEERMYKKLGELDDTGGKEPWGYLLTAERMTDKVRERAQAKSSKSLDSTLTQSVIPSREKTDGGGDSPHRWTSILSRAAGIGGPEDKMPTGFETLDRATRGGLRPRRILIVGGAPGAGKTNLAMQLAVHYARSGKPVSVLAADEEADGLLCRVGQNLGLRREDIEEGKAREQLSSLVQALPLDLIDADEEGATIENVAGALAERGPGVLILDSLQSVRSDTSLEKENIRERINDIMLTLRQVVKRYGHVVIATCELARASYRNKNIADQIEDLAAFKESGDIEYGMTIGLVLRNPEGDGGTVTISMPKNRLGTKLPFCLQLNPLRSTFREVPMPVKEEKEADALRAEKTKAEVLAFVKECDKGGKKLSSKNQIYLAMKAVGKGYQKGLVWDAISILESEHKLFKQGGTYLAA